MMLRTSSKSSTPLRCPSWSMTGKTLRWLSAMTLTNSPNVISGKTVVKSVSSTFSIFKSVSTLRSLLCVSSSPFCANRMA